MRCSTDSGQTWSVTDIRTRTNAKNPALAFNSQGRLGLLYQQVTSPAGGDRWVTRVEVYDASFTRLTNTVLATTPATTPAPQFLPYIGDYVHLMAMNEIFYGIFSANNTPDLNNFPPGVTYQRNANFTTNQLQNLNGNPVAVSIDPFFFTLEVVGP